MIDDHDDLAIWRARTARTCRCCGCKSVVDGRCTVCGAAKVVAGEPWKVSTREGTPTTNASAVPAAETAKVAEMPARAAEAPQPMRPSVARTSPRTTAAAAKPEQRGFGF